MATKPPTRKVDSKIQQTLSETIHHASERLHYFVWSQLTSPRKSTARLRQQAHPLCLRTVSLNIHFNMVPWHSVWKNMCHVLEDFIMKDQWNIVKQSRDIHWKICFKAVRGLPACPPILGYGWGWPTPLLWMPMIRCSNVNLVPLWNKQNYLGN